MIKTGHVLVVDDDDTVRVGLFQTLESEGYVVSTAASGSEAIETMSQTPAEVVLLDIMMPGMSGLEVLKILRSDYPDTVVIMVTAVGDINTATSAIKDGAYDYVTKPFALDDIVQSVARAREKRKLILGERQHLQELEGIKEHQKAALEQQFMLLVQALAREHATVLKGRTTDKSAREPGAFSELPPELRSPKATIQEFAEALLKVIERGGLTSR